MKISSSIEGLDKLLMGGFIKGRAYYIKGESGTGRTTLGLQFLIEGAKGGERVLFITLTERAEYIKENSKKLFLEVEGVDFLDLTPSAEYYRSSYDIFHPGEVERERIFEEITRKIEEISPRRVFIDSISEFRRLVPNVFVHKRQVISFLKFLNSKDATVLFTSETTSEIPDQDLEYVADGIIELKRDEEGFKISVRKMRGSDFIPGWHKFEIGEEGIKIHLS
ncbi:MAG: ATPase domain-containing protein [Archaeoglobaceae archaeon]|nr:ATPase domain-containing protein [Archaeoglobaceae archaeon]